MAACGSTMKPMLSPAAAREQIPSQEPRVTVTDASPRELAALLPQASVEISSRGHQLDELRANFGHGIDVTIPSLPGDNYRHNVATASALRRVGFNPVPHIAAREIASRQAL